MVPEPRRLAFVLLHGEIKTPPFSKEARIEAGVLIGRLQDGERIGMPLSRPMPSIGPGCHELRVRDRAHNWRIVYRIDDVAVVVLGVFAKKTQKTPRAVVANCKRRLALYLAAQQGGE